MILTLRTDNAVAEIGLYDADGKRLHYFTWQVDRRLAKELLQTLLDQMTKAGATFATLTGIVVYRGPGSFTGLRIGIATANTIAYAREIPIVGEMEDDWIASGIARLAAGKNDRIVLPHYDIAPNISTQKK